MTSTGIEGVKGGTWKIRKPQRATTTCPAKIPRRSGGSFFAYLLSHIDVLALKTNPNFPFDETRHDDATLLRFLRARKFDIAASKFMIENCEQWRKDFGVDDLVK